MLSGDGWTRLERVSLRVRGRCHEGIQQSGGSCVLILVSFWLDLAHIERMQRVVSLFVFLKLG